MHSASLFIFGHSPKGVLVMIQNRLLEWYWSGLENGNLNGKFKPVLQQNQYK